MATKVASKKKILESVSDPAEPVIITTPEVPNVLSAEHRKEIEMWLAGARTRSGLMAFAGFKVNKKGELKISFKETHAACTGSLRYAPKAWDENEGCDYLAIAFNGESPADIGPGHIYRGSEHTFEGGEISLAWLKFLTDPNGYWRDVLPFIANLDDLDLINNETGFIFTDLRKLPAEPTFNFLIATRWAQEQNKRAVHWYKMLQSGIDPAIAFIAAQWYNEKGTLMASPHHTIAYSPPKTWAKNFYKREPFKGWVKTGDHPAKPSGIAYTRSNNTYVGLSGLIGENSWFNHKKSSLNMADGFFGMKGGRMLTDWNHDQLIEEITTFVNS